MTATDAQWMAEAFAYSCAQWGRATPNPTVGAVVLDSAGNFLAAGVTEAVGGRHAEIVALDAAGERARGGTIVVTLEPCNHHGRTGPCSERILSAGISRVVYALSDPHPQAQGGARRLAEAGCEVRGNVGITPDGSGADVLTGPLGAWLHRQRTGLPRVTWKFAATLDGRSAAADGSSQWITGPEARAHTLARRSRYDAIVVGSGTVRTDDPSLTARNSSGELLTAQPLRCAMGLTPVPETARIRGQDGRFRHLRTQDPQAALSLLATEDNVIEVLLEGGPQLAGAFLAAGAVNRIEGYLAPMVLGSGPTALGPAGVETIATAHRFKMCSIERIGEDIFVELLPRHDEAEANGVKVSPYQPLMG